MSGPNDPLEPYYLALGRFLHRYALVEANLHNVLRVATRITPAKAKAIYSGTRAGQAMTFIRRICEADGSELSPWLEKAFPKLNEITKVRDEILHHGFTLSGDTIAVVNRRTLERAMSSKAFNIYDILDLDADICTIHACLSMYFYEDRPSRTTKVNLERERQIAQSSWRYKPRKVESVRRGTRSAQKQPNPDYSLDA